MVQHYGCVNRRGITDIPLRTLSGHTHGVHRGRVVRVKDQNVRPLRRQSSGRRRPCQRQFLL